MKIITKHPDDVRPFTVNFSLALPSGTTITGGTVTAADKLNNNITSTIVDSVSFTTNKITAFLKGGADGLRGTLKYTATCSDAKTVLNINIDFIISDNA